MNDPIENLITMSKSYKGSKNQPFVYAGGI